MRKKGSRRCTQFAQFEKFNQAPFKRQSKKKVNKHVKIKTFM